MARKQTEQQLPREEKPVMGEHKLTLDDLQLLIYNLLYFIGSSVIHYGRRASRKIRSTAKKCYWFSKRSLICFGDFLVEKKDDFLRHAWILPFQNMAKNWKQDLTDLKNAIVHMDGEAIKDVLFSLPRTFKIVGHVVNYILPVAGCLVFVSTFLYYDNLNYALGVEYNGEHVGYIRNESDFAAAEKNVQNRVIAGDFDFPDDYIPQYSLQVVDDSQISTVEELTNRLIEGSGTDIQEASGLYVDGEFVGATTDGEGLVLELKNMLDEVRNTVSKDAEVGFAQDVKVDKALYPTSSIVDLSSISAELVKEVAGERTYIIQPGDTPHEVARNNEVPLDTLISNNEEVVKTFLPGNSLLLESAASRLEKKVVETVTEESTITFETEQVLNINLEKGVTQVKQAGQNGTEKVTYEVTYVDGYETERTVISRETVEEPVTAILEVGALMTAQSLDNVSGRSVGGFIWPVDGGFISCPIRGYYGHTGTDIAADRGTAIYASADGTVTFAGWLSSYGYTIKIDHGNNIQTLYAHNTDLLVSEGQFVQQGQLIATVGSTGNSSGPHCHFEIIMNNEYMDARDYIGTEYKGK